MFVKGKQLKINKKLWNDDDASKKRKWRVIFGIVPRNYHSTGILFAYYAIYVAPQAT